MFKKLGLGMLAALVVTAAPAWAQVPGTSDFGVMTSVDARDHGLDMHVNVASPMACSYSGVFRVVPTAANHDVLVSTAMTAFVSGKKIRFFVYGCAPDGASLVASLTVEA
jgi:hypothetical protein